MDEFETSIRQFIVRQIMLKKDETALKADQSLIEAGVIDSLGIQMLVPFLEERYRITVPEGELYPENFETIKTIADLVKKIRGT